MVDVGGVQISQEDGRGRGGKGGGSSGSRSTARSGYSGGRSGGRSGTSGRRSGGVFGGSAKPRYPVARASVNQPRYPVAKPGGRSGSVFGGSSKPRYPVARAPLNKPHYPVAKPVVNRPHNNVARPVTNSGFGRRRKTVIVMNSDGRRRGGSFSSGFALGAGSMYLHNRLHDPYRYHRYHDPYYYRNYYGPTHVIHHHHYNSDGPYFHHHWQTTSSYNTVAFDSHRPPSLPRYRRARGYTSSWDELRQATAILYLDASEFNIEPVLYYRLDNKKDELRSLDKAKLNDLMNIRGSGSNAPEFGQLREHLMKSDFSKLEAGIQFYYQGLTTRTKLVGVALIAMIASLPEYEGNVTKAQSDLDKLNWPRVKPAKTQIMMRVLSAKQQAQYELLSAAKFEYQGVASMDAVSGARIGDKQLGEQSFGAEYRKQVRECNTCKDADAEQFEKVKAALALPQAEEEAKWNPDADCGGEKAEALAQRLGREIKKRDNEELSTEKLQQQVMKDYKKSFVSGTKQVQLKGGWVITGKFCHGAALADLGFCAKASKPCEELKSDCAKVLNPSAQACQEYKEKCEFLSADQAIPKLVEKYERMKKEGGECSDFFDLMYTRVAIEQWFHKDARFAFTNEVGGYSVAASSGIALLMFDSSDQMAKEAGQTMTPSRGPSPSQGHGTPPGVSHTEITHTGVTRVTHTYREEGRGSGGAAIGVMVVCTIVFCGCCLCTVWFCWRTFGSDDDDASYYGGRFSQESLPYQPEYLDFQCPMGNCPGDLVQVTLPDGNSMQVTVPDGVYGGMNFSVQI